MLRLLFRHSFVGAHQGAEPVLFREVLSMFGWCVRSSVDSDMSRCLLQKFSDWPDLCKFEDANPFVIIIDVETMCSKMTHAIRLQLHDLLALSRLWLSSVQRTNRRANGAVAARRIFWPSSAIKRTHWKRFWREIGARVFSFPLSISR